MTDMTAKTVLITGASRGIGAAAARTFAAAGANVVLVARSTLEIADIAGEIGDRALAIPCDVAGWSEMARAVQATLDTFGRLDVLIGNAGIIEPIGDIAETDPAGWTRVIDVNLKGVYHGMRAAIPVMEAQGGGTIITISSGAAHRPLPGWSAYCTSKAAAKMLTDSAHAEHGETLRIMGLSPGTVATQMQRDIKASGVGPVAQLDWEDHIPPEWPAKALLWMCSPEADDLRGSELSLRDEGLRARIGLTA
ncbi:SDR family oxidoreductase [Jannaschia seohaensis]|uniref:NADP-dependent 3-hydroxy acid dehydrogenase YdfG n=1 Tax=Jannaschia seohaensis TaxID=475081 RepID=A0A2Y9C3W5_9RHOB|nr:SDR family oxidoreductase [Jannaschia seohaensis]PWJ22255.1 NADP-dependent 3-hydroxy acid dehydrogenase YdfG [Jannaschia seohaensis]SSA38533.1 NADP-dependent 3-hydroxy acid dehydrogenase YdfG [Jannaschia seohaensis]